MGGEVGDLGHGEVAVEEVDLPGLEEHPHRLGVGDDLHDELVDLGTAAEVAGVGHHGVVVVQGPFLEDEGPGPAGRLRGEPVLVAEGLRELLVQDGSLGAGHDRQEGDERLRQGDLDGVLVEGLQAGGGGRLALHAVLRPEDEVEDVGVQGLGLRVEHAVEGVDDVTGGEFLAVLEPDSLAEMEGVDLAVLGNIPLRGQAGDEGRLAGGRGGAFDEAVVDVHGDHVA